MVHQKVLALAMMAPASAAPSPEFPFPPSYGSNSAVNTTVCNGKQYIYEELAGFGYSLGNATDKFGDTLGGIGSAIAIDRTSWRWEGTAYKGTLWALPDRGWNTEGTLNYQNRVHKIAITLNINEKATAQKPSKPNLDLKYLDTVRFTDPKGQPMSGLDGDAHGPYLTYNGIPVDVPSAHYAGDGFGGAGPGGQKAILDSEGLFLGRDGSFWVSDEYGPYVYQFDRNGKMVGAIRPPDAIIPTRNGNESFSANSPPRYDPTLAVVPGDPQSGRSNNQGLEGLTTNPERTKLYALLQSATIQDGGSKNSNSGNTRFVVYDITTSPAVLTAEYVVTLPHVNPNDTSSKVARQSEIHYVSDTQFLVLARDSNAGNGQKTTQSIYRQADIFDISKATNVKGKADCATCSIASSKGVLQSNVTAAEYCKWLDFNVNDQLNRFGAHNGGATDDGLLNEKWESLALVPVNPLGFGDEYFLFSLSDNDFITQNGHMNGGKLPYADSSGYNLNNQALAFKVKLPSGSRPLNG